MCYFNSKKVMLDLIHDYQLTNRFERLLPLVYEDCVRRWCFRWMLGWWKGTVKMISNRKCMSGSESHIKANKNITLLIAGIIWTRNTKTHISVSHDHTVNHVLSVSNCGELKLYLWNNKLFLHLVVYYQIFCSICIATT